MPGEGRKPEDIAPSRDVVVTVATPDQMSKYIYFQALHITFLISKSFCYDGNDILWKCFSSSFHSLPRTTDENIRVAWRIALGKPVLPKDARICALHFRKEDFRKWKNGKTFLMPTAVPSERLEGLRLEETKVKAIRQTAFQALNSEYNYFSQEDSDEFGEDDDEDEREHIPSKEKDSDFSPSDDQAGFLFVHKGHFLKVDKCHL